MQLNFFLRAISSVCKGNVDFVCDFRAFLKQSIQQRGCAIGLHRLLSAMRFIVIIVPVTYMYVFSLGCWCEQDRLPSCSVFHIWEGTAYVKSQCHVVREAEEDECSLYLLVPDVKRLDNWEKAEKL